MYVQSKRPHKQLRMIIESSDCRLSCTVLNTMYPLFGSPVMLITHLLSSALTCLVSHIAIAYAPHQYLLIHAQARAHSRRRHFTSTPYTSLNLGGKKDSYSRHSEVQERKIEQYSCDMEHVLYWREHDLFTVHYPSEETAKSFSLYASLRFAYQEPSRGLGGASLFMRRF